MKERLTTVSNNVSSSDPGCRDITETHTCGTCGFQVSRKQDVHSVAGEEETEAHIL